MATLNNLAIYCGTATTAPRFAKIVAPSTITIKTSSCDNKTPKIIVLLKPPEFKFTLDVPSLRWSVVSNDWFPILMVMFNYLWSLSEHTRPDDAYVSIFMVGGLPPQLISAEQEIQTVRRKPKVTKI